MIEKIKKILEKLTIEEKYVTFKILKTINFDIFILPEVMAQYAKEHGDLKDDDWDDNDDALFK